MSGVRRTLITAPPPSPARVPGGCRTGGRPTLEVITCRGSTTLVGQAAIIGARFVLVTGALVDGQLSPNQGLSTGPVEELVDEVGALAPDRWIPSATAPPGRDPSGRGLPTLPVQRHEPAIPVDDLMAVGSALLEGDDAQLAAALQVAGLAEVPPWVEQLVQHGTRGTFTMTLVDGSGGRHPRQQVLTHVLVLERDWVELSADPRDALHGRVITPAAVRGLLISACATLAGRTAA